MTRHYEELGVTEKVMTDIIRPDWARKTIYVYHKLQICLSATRINHLRLISRRVAFWCLASAWNYNWETDHKIV